MTEQLRQVLLDALNGRRPSSSMAWEVTQKWDALEARVRELEEALRAVFEVAVVANDGDPWYCEHEGIDVEAAFAKARPLLVPANEETAE